MEKSKEHTIYLKDLVFAALYRWKWIVVFALIFGLLLGGMEYLSGKNNAITLNTTTITPENQVKIDQLKRNLEQTTLNIEQQTIYLDESVLMELDPFNVYTTSFQVFPIFSDDVNIELENDDLSNRILRAYRNHLSQNSVMDAIGKEINIPAKYLAELITFDSAASGYLGVIVRGRTQKEAQQIADDLLAIVQAQVKQISQADTAHTLQILSFNAGPKLDTALYDTQNSARQKLTSLKNTLVSIETDLKKYEPTELVSGDAKPILFAAVGAFAGAFVVVCVVWVAHIASNKVYSARTLKDYSGLRILGCVGTGRKYGCVLRMFRKWEGRSDCACAEAIAANIRNRCDGIQNLLIAGNYADSAITPITQLLEECNIHCTCLGDPAQSKAVLDALPDCDGVLLVETCGASCYDHVVWEAETVNDHSKPLLGCVLIGG